MRNALVVSTLQPVRAVGIVSPELPQMEFILTMKLLLGRLLLVPYRRDALQREVGQIAEWYNASRPHTWLGGKTPDEAYYGKFPANRRPRFEPRSRWPRGSPYAKPWALVRGNPGAKLTLEVTSHADCDRNSNSSPNCQ
jgi:hypothetical protein